MSLFDLTNQPNGLILGEYAGTPLYSIEDNYTYQYNGNGIIQRTSSGVETIKYSTDLAFTEVNNIYQLTFDISLSQPSDNLGTEAKIEFQHGIDGDIGSTFFELSYDDLIQLNVGNPLTTFTAQYTAPIGNQSILQIKSTEVGFYIQNIQVENLGVEEPDEEVLTPGGTTNDPYLRVCLCDGTPNSNGSFKKDIQYWLDNDVDEYGFDSAGLDNGDSTVGFDSTYYVANEIPESMYPSNCIGYDYALFKVAQRYPEIDDPTDIAIFHDPSLCVFGGMELNTNKQNLIGLTWQDFVNENLFGMGDNPIITRELSPSTFDPFIVFNKSGLHNDFQRASEGDLSNGEDSAIEAIITYDLSKSNSNIYHPPIQWIGDGDGLNDGFDAIYRTFSNSYTGDYPDGVGEQHNPTYTTSENIFPIYDDIEDAPIRVETDPRPGDNWSDDNDPEETVWPGKCPPQYDGHENRYGFGAQTLGGFGPVMCDESHFNIIYETWLDNNEDNRENPLIKPSNPFGTLHIDTNPDNFDIEIPIYANFPDNDTFNFIKQKFNETYPDTYKKYIKIFIPEPENFSSVKVLNEIDEVIEEINLSTFAGSTILQLSNNGIPFNQEIGGDNFKEQYGKILFTPASSNFEKTTYIRYEVQHIFIDRFIDEENFYKIYTDHISGGEYDGNIKYLNTGYDGNKIYNYGSDYSINNGANFTEDLYNGHFNRLWNNIGPVGDGDDEGTANRFTDDNVRDVETGDVFESDNYPNNYWSYEWDEQSYRSPARDSDNEYQNMIHWSYRYSFPFYPNDRSYLPDDLQSQSIGDIISDFDETPIDGLSISGTSHLPWPEQVIGRYDSHPTYDINGILNKFNGSYGGAYEIEIFITGTIQFSGGFGVPGFDVDLNPSLDKSYDPYSGIDVRPEIIDDNICQHIELMKVQSQGGDGLFYKAENYPYDSDDDAIHQFNELTCDTVFYNSLFRVSKIRARCSDGSTVLIADTGNSEYINYPYTETNNSSNDNDGNNFFHFSGIDACTYASNYVRSYPNNKQFHFGVNLDKRPSLGLFYYEEDNQASENFAGNIGDEFEQYPNTNLVTNGNGSIVETTETYYADEDAPDSYHPQAWLTGFINDLDPGVFRERNTINYEGYKDSDEGQQYTNQFIQSPDFNPNLGYYRFVGYETYSHMTFFSDENYYKEWKPRWIFEETDYEYKGDTHDNIDNWGEAGKDGFIYASGKHPRCHSAGKCLNFNANKSMINASWNKALLSDVGDTTGITSFAPYIHLNQFQQILTSDEATQLFYHDVQSMPELKVSFWMYTKSDGVEGENYITPQESVLDVTNNQGHLDSGEEESYGDISNPEFPEIEIAVVRGNPLSDTSRYHPKADLNSLSNPSNIAGSGRFKNTVLDEWERFEFNFSLDYSRFYNETTRKFTELNLLVQYSGLKVIDLNGELPSFDNGEFVLGNRYDVIPGNVYLDDFSVTETGEFIPDVDVRAKKGQGNYGVGSLTEYYDPMIEEQLEAYNDTTAPLEAQFYFYARFFNEQVFDREDTLKNRFGSDATFRSELIANDFRRGRFYLYDVDFGDGSPKEFTDKPLRLGNDVAVYHTYTKSGIYEVTGYMLRTRPTKNEDGTPNHDEPVGVLHNKKFTVRINVNEGLDEDFEFFGSEEGFSYLPYKNISPVIGGVSKESSYYKGIKRQLGFAGNECRQVEFSLRSDQTPPGDDKFYLAQDYPYFDEDVIPNFDGDLSNIGCNFDFYSILGGGTPNNIQNVSFIRALCGDGTYALIGDADGRSMDIQSSPDDVGNYADFFHLTGHQACGGAKTSIYFEKESDKLKTEIALSKMDSSLNNDFEILPEFQIPRYSEPPPTDGSEQGGELIYGGITTNEEELGKSLGDVDLTNVRFFNEPKEIYQMLGFTCDNNQTEIDLIPLEKPEYGLNYSNHSRTFTNVNDIQSPYFTNVSKVANQYENGNLIKDGNAIRFGHDFRIDDIEGLGVGQWNHIDNAFVNTLAFNTPDLGYNQTYTYSTHIYIPFGYCEDGRPCSEEDNNQYTVMCSECNGAQQYDEGGNFNVRIVQNMNDPIVGENDWVQDLWLNDIVGGEWAGVHNIGVHIDGGAATFKFRQFDAFNHCHPKGVNNPRFKYAWSNGEVFPIRDGQYCGGLDYSACGLLNASGDADGCYWDGDENEGYCKPATLLQNADPINISCWIATTEEECVDGCEWYGDGSNNSNFETPISIPYENIITDEWFRLDFPFTTKEPSEFGNHISLRFDTHLGVNRTSFEYEEISENLVSGGDFTRPDLNLDVDYLASLPFPFYLQEFDIFPFPDGDGGVGINEQIIWRDEVGRPDIAEHVVDEIVVGQNIPPLGDSSEIRPIETFFNTSDEIEDWLFFGEPIGSSETIFVSTLNQLYIFFAGTPVSAEQIHIYDNTTYNKTYKLKYQVVYVNEIVNEQDLKLFIIGRDDGYVVDQNIELPIDTAGVKEVVFTSDNDRQIGGGDGGDSGRDDTENNEGDEGGGNVQQVYQRTLNIGHQGSGEFDNGFPYVIIDNIELHEVSETEINTTTPNDGLYTFGAQLLVGDYSGDDLIPYTTEDLNPGDCADFQSGNPSNPRYWKNIIPNTYPATYRDGISSDDIFSTNGGQFWPNPLGQDQSHPDIDFGDTVWRYNEDNMIFEYTPATETYVCTVLENADNDDKGERLHAYSFGMYDHIVGDNCGDGEINQDGLNLGCYDLIDEDDITQWFEFKFTYMGTETNVGGETDQSLRGIRIGFDYGIKITADDWDKTTQGPKDGTEIDKPSHPSYATIQIYGRSGTYQQQPHPDFFQQAQCVIGQECTIWVHLLSNPYGRTPTYHNIELRNGQEFDKTTWKNFSLRRADEALGIVDLEDLINVNIDYSSQQEWIGENEYGNTYYYPVLPRYGLNGTFESANNQFYPGGDYDYPNDNIPFPIDAVVTEENPQEQSMLINIYNEQDETNVFKDGSGNDNNAFVINDYKPKYNEETSEPQSIKNVDRIRTSKDKGAF